MGGNTLGIHNAGLNVLAFNDFDKAPTDCHKLNFLILRLFANYLKKNQKIKQILN